MFVLMYVIAPKCLVYFKSASCNYIATCNDPRDAYHFIDRDEALEEADFLKMEFGVDFEIIKLSNAIVCE